MRPEVVRYLRAVGPGGDPRSAVLRVQLRTRPVDFSVADTLLAVAVAVDGELGVSSLGHSHAEYVLR